MADPMAGKYSREFKREFAIAALVLKDQPGTLAWSKNDYEAFRFVGQGATIIFYPHKVRNTGNKHIRIREQGSTDKNLAEKLMALLDIGAGHCCTFHQNHHRWNFSNGIAQALNLKHGWAHDLVDWKGNVIQPKREGLDMNRGGNG